MPVANFFIRGGATGMSMDKVAIADTTRAVATNISLVGEVRDSRRGRRVVFKRMFNDFFKRMFNESDIDF
jgi:hypothetical protein